MTNFFYSSKNIKTFFVNFLMFNILIIFFFYFTYVAIFGNYGLKKNIELEFQIIELNNNLTLLKEETFHIENKTNKLNKNNIDLDLLDQQARVVLGLIRNDEIMIIK